MKVFTDHESSVRSYCRSFPTIFTKAKDAFIYSRDGKRYIDFFCGAGSLNYGHNNETLKQALMEYITADGITHGLDMATEAKERFIESFNTIILQPRGLAYKMQFAGPTGANANEAAMKLAKKVTGRSGVITFTRAYHGHSAGALSITANQYYRQNIHLNRTDIAFVPFDGYLGEQIDTLEILRKLLEDTASGVDIPAAIFVETVQAEGGVNIARDEWLRGLSALCVQHKILLIVDDIQVGAGRTGKYFSFEQAGIKPDIVTLSKSISGYGLPMSLVLIKPEHDIWLPGEHTGTFRGNNLAFVTAAAALQYWTQETFCDNLQRTCRTLSEKLESLAAGYATVGGAKTRGRGLIRGFELTRQDICDAIAQEAFKRGLIIERCGPHDTVFKFLPSLIIDPQVLDEGLAIFQSALESVNWNKSKI